MDKNKALIESDRIYLREVKISDADRAYLNWMNDKDVIQFLDCRFDKWTKMKLKNYVKEVKADARNIFLAIVIKEGNKHIGNVKIGPVHYFNKCADVGIIIGDKSYWGKGLATETLNLVIDYMFNKLHLHKLTAGIYTNNTGSIKAFKKAGFEIEGVLKKHCFYEGSYIDAILLGIING